MTRFLPLLNDFAGGLGLGVIAAMVTLACFHPVHAAMVIRWIAG